MPSTNDKAMKNAPKTETTQHGAPQGQTATAGSHEPRDWRSTAEELIEEVRRSEMLTREDLAIRINARD